jgi:hypothetical protein
MNKLKVYCVNYDGKENRYVATNSLKQASILMNVSYYHMHLYGHETFNKQHCEQVMSKPGAVFKGKITDYGLLTQISL